MNEIWKPVVGYEGLYEVSNKGRVKSLYRQIERVLADRKSGREQYKAVLLYNKGIARNKLVHRLVLEAFVGPCPIEMETRHLDGNSINNTPDNLVWGTRKENIGDQIRHGRNFFVNGNGGKKEKHPKSKLTSIQIDEIRGSTKSGVILSKEYGVCPQQISRIRRYERWK